MSSVRQFDRWVALVRAVAVPFAVYQVAVTKGEPPGWSTAGWTTTGVFAAGAAVLLALSRMELRDRPLYVAGVAALAFDTAVVSAYVVSYSVERGTLTPEALFLPLVEGCIRFALVGGFVVAAVTAPVMAAFELVYADHFDEPFRYDFVTLHVGLELLLAATIGWLVLRLGGESRLAAERAQEAERLGRELARRVDAAEAANRCARALGSSLDLETAFAGFLRELRTLVPFDRVAIVLAEDGCADVMATAGRGADTVFPPGSRAPLQGSILEEVLTATAPVYRPRLDPSRFREEGDFLRLGLGSRLAAPLVAGPRAIGMLSFVRSEPEAFAPDEIDLAGQVGRIAATAVQNLRLHETERRTSEELRTLAGMRADFVSLVSHELRTPLTSVLGSARTLQARWQELDTEGREAFLGLIAGESERLAALVGDVLDTSRIDTGTFAYSFADADVAAIVEEAVAAATLGREHARVDARIWPALPPVHGDGRRLRQVIGNLIDNALKYSPEGERVEVRATAVGGAVVVDVSDRGRGVAPADHGLVFEKFGRVAGTAAKPGTGLGLYIARAIAEAHGGTLQISSAPGLGATFTLTLPAT